MVEEDMEHVREKGQGMVPRGSKIEIRWSSKVSGNGLPHDISPPKSNCLSYCCRDTWKPGKIVNCIVLCIVYSSLVQPKRSVKTACGVNRSRSNCCAQGREKTAPPRAGTAR